jgi:alpha-glucosidase (family GH31 glycosyl hydrolase)
LLPYLYSLAHEASRTSRPLMRPLFLEFPDDPAGWNLDDQWLLGPSLLAAPFFAPGGSRQVYLPEDGWYPFGGGPPLAGRQTLNVSLPLDQMPLYVRSGSIIPLAPVMQHSEARPLDELQVEVYPGRDAEFLLHEDDGTTHAYLQGKTATTRFTWSERERSLAIGRTVGDYAGKPVLRSYLVRLYGQAGPAAVSMHGIPARETQTPASAIPGWKYDRSAGCIIVSTGRINSATQELLLRIGD